MSSCVAAGAASFFPFSLTLSKGMDSGSWGCSIFFFWENPPCFVKGPKPTGYFFLSSLPTIASHAMGLPHQWSGEMYIKAGRRRQPGGPQDWGCPTFPCLPPPPPSLGLAWPPAHLPLGGSELRSRCFREENKMLWGGRDKKSPPFSTSRAPCTQFLPTWAPEFKDMHRGLRPLQGQGKRGASDIDKQTTHPQKEECLEMKV